MATVAEFQTTRGTALATFTQGGTFSNFVDMGGCALVGLYSDNWPGAAGSITFRASWNPSGTGWPVMTEAGVIGRVNGFGSGTYYNLTAGSVITAAQYLMVQLPAGGTAGIAAGGTIVLVGRA
jgi:hypothetical protein